MLNAAPAILMTQHATRESAFSLSLMSILTRLTSVRRLTHSVPPSQLPRTTSTTSKRTVTTISWTVTRQETELWSPAPTYPRYCKWKNSSQQSKSWMMATTSQCHASVEQLVSRLSLKVSHWMMARLRKAMRWATGAPQLQSSFPRAWISLLGKASSLPSCHNYQSTPLLRQLFLNSRSDTISRVASQRTEILISRLIKLVILHLYSKLSSRRPSIHNTSSLISKARPKCSCSSTLGRARSSRSCARRKSAAIGRTVTASMGIR